MGSLYKRGNTWRTKYSGQNGKGYRQSTKSEKKMVATHLLNRREGEIAEGQNRTADTGIFKQTLRIFKLPNFVVLF